MFHSFRRLRRTLALSAISVSLTAASIAAVTAIAAPQALAAQATGGGGASLPYTEVLAQNSPTTGTVIGPSYTQGQLADEAVGREAVTLAGSGSGQSVTFTTPTSTNSIDFRYSIPDTSDGSVYTAPLSLYINGVKQPDFTLTNAYSWYYGSYPFVNTPSAGIAHHFYDEVHRLFSTTYPAGTQFTLQVDPEDTASSYTINLADFEQVAAAPAQAGSVSVVSEGADPTGVSDSSAAFAAAITAAGAGGTVWIPPGSYLVPGHVAVPSNITIDGAGMWYSTIIGAAPGFYGNAAPNPSTGVTLENFAISGNVQIRDDSAQVNGIGGAYSNSTIENIWIEHMKVGVWLDGPMTNLTISGMRIRDTTADGINLHGGTTDTTITNNNVRNTGDDGIALWSDSGIGADAYVTISDNTVQQQQLANGIAVYGGNNNTVNGNLVEDTGITQGGGITVAQRFTSTPLGLTTVSNNTMIRDGNLDPNWEFGVGALWFDGSQGWGGGPVNVTNALIEQSPFEAVEWVEGTISNVNLTNVSIIGTGTFALQEQTGGTATFTNVTATGVAQANAGNAPSYNCEGGNFVITDDGGNSGLSPTQCGPWPAPVYPPPVYGVNASPTALNFGPQLTGTTSAAQSVTVTNSTSTAAAVSSVSTTGDFAQTNTCGSSIAANGSCTVNVTYSPTVTGSETGSLTVNAGGVTSAVSLSGTGTAPGPVLNSSPAGLSFPATLVGNTDAPKSVTVTNSGTTAATVSSVAVTGGAYSQTNNCTTIAVGGSCTVTVTFSPTAATNPGTLTVTSNANNSPLTVGLTGNGITSTTNLALNQPATASTSDGTYVASNVTDGDTTSYWESNDGTAYPQTVTVQLAQTYPIGSLTLDLPPSTAWATRSETLSVLGSTNGTTFSQIVGSATYTFNPATGNTVTISLPSGTSAQYVELSFTANTGWSAAQLSELEVFPGTGGGGTSPGSALTASPSSLSFASTTVGSASAAQTVTVSNPNTSAVPVSSVSASGPFSQTNTCGSSIAAGGSCTASVTFSPTATGSAAGTLSVASSATGSPLTVALSGTGASATGSALTASPSSVSFASTTVGSASAAQTVTVSNPNTSAVSVSSVSASGPFSQTNTCGSSIAAGGSCTASVTFTPTATGSAAGTLSVASNAAGSPLAVALSGTGASATGNALTASPSSVAFASTTVGSASAAQTVTVSNPNTSAVSVSSVSASGPFSQTNTCGSSIAAGGSCTASVTFTPTATGSAAGTLSVASNAAGSPLTVALSGTGTASSNTNLALNQPVTASSDYEAYVPANVTDGNTSSYWESADGAAYPQTLTVNLGSVQSIGSVTLDLPPAAAWATRTETLSVLGFANDTTFSQIVGSAGYTFNPATGNTVTISLPSGTSAQYVQLSFTANTGWTAAQLSEFEVFSGGGSTGGSSALTASPSSVSFASTVTGSTSPSQTITVTNPGTSAATVSSVAVTGPFSQASTCGTSIAAGGSCTVTVKFTPTATGAASGTLSVASTATGSPLTVALSGTGVSSTTDLALNAPVTASSYTQTYVPSNAVDGNTSTYWEATNGAWPATYTVNLGSVQALASSPSTCPRQRPGRPGPRPCPSSAPPTTPPSAPSWPPPPTPGTPPPATPSPSRSRPEPPTSTWSSASPPTASRTAHRPPKSSSTRES